MPEFFLRLGRQTPHCACAFLGGKRNVVSHQRSPHRLCVPSPNPLPQAGEGAVRRGSCEYPVQEPFRAHCLASVETLAVEPEPMALRIFGAEIIAGRRVLALLPFGGDAFGAFDGGDLVEDAAPFEAQGRAIRNFGDRFDQFGPLEQAKRARRRQARSPPARELSGRLSRAWTRALATLGMTATANSGICVSISCGFVTRRAPSRALKRSTRSARLRSRSPSCARSSSLCAGAAVRRQGKRGARRRRHSRRRVSSSPGASSRSRNNLPLASGRRAALPVPTLDRRIAPSTRNRRTSNCRPSNRQNHWTMAPPEFPLPHVVPGSECRGGFLFWLICSRFYSPNVVGLAAAFISLGSLIGAFTTLGLPNTVLRFLPTTDLKGRLVSQALLIVGLFSLVVGWGAGLLLHIFIPRLPDSGESGFYAWTIVSLVVFLTLLTLLDNVCLAYRRADFVLYRQLITTIPRLAMPFLLTGLALRGLLLAFVITLALGVIYDAIIVYRRLLIGQSIIPSGTTLWTYRRYSGSNFLGGMFGILPSSLLPLIVLHDLGADNAAYFYMPFQIATLLNLVCSSTAAALLSEASQTENIEHQRQLLKAAATH